MSRPRHFTQGKRITTAATIERAIRRGDWFYFGGGGAPSPKHGLVIGNTPFVYVCDIARRGCLFLAKPTAFRLRFLAALSKPGDPWARAEKEPV